LKKKNHSIFTAHLNNLYTKKKKKIIKVRNNQLLKGKILQVITIKLGIMKTIIMKIMMKKIVVMKKIVSMKTINPMKKRNNLILTDSKY